MATRREEMLKAELDYHVDDVPIPSYVELGVTLLGLLVLSPVLVPAVVFGHVKTKWVLAGEKTVARSPLGRVMVWIRQRG